MLLREGPPCIATPEQSQTKPTTRPKTFKANGPRSGTPLPDISPISQFLRKFSLQFPHEPPINGPYEN